MRCKVAALVLAAGCSRRMGAQNKLLIDIGGTPMIRRIVDCVCASGVSETMVVTGHESRQVGRSLKCCDVKLRYNSAYEKGLSASLKCGLAALRDCEGVLVILGDMPRISTQLVNRLIERFRADGSRPIVIPFFAGQRGNPVVLPRRFFAELQGISGDQGARKLISLYPHDVYEVHVDDPGVLFDIDLPVDLGGLECS